ncbi:MAG: M15 family metallopeptidase [Acidimicrobiia bacterium]|nr:M15 family metallopeptidase [Acidimicrobiia bacterium]
MKLPSAVVALLLFAAACSDSGTTTSTTQSPEAAPPSTTTTTVAATIAPKTSTTPTTTTVAPNPFARPEWMGTRLLVLREDGFGEIPPTPPEFDPRALETLDLLPPPPDDQFASTLGPVPADVLARSSWVEECPVTPEQLSYVTVTHWGFDERYHTGEIIVNAEVAEEIVAVFGQLHAAQFPIEQMRVIRKEEIDAHPTGDWNDTTSFVCRPAVGSGNWSQHALGLAIDINPFHNPYLKGDLVLPELASAYLDRADQRQGMVEAGDAVYRAFTDIGWGWGGQWNSLKDWMHFSRNGH